MTYFELIDKLKEIGKKTKWIIAPMGQIRQKDEQVCPICAIANEKLGVLIHRLDWTLAALEANIPFFQGNLIVQAADIPVPTPIRQQLIEALNPEMEDKAA